MNDIKKTSINGDQLPGRLVDSLMYTPQLRCAACGKLCATDISKHFKNEHNLTKSQYVIKYKQPYIMNDRTRLNFVCEKFLDANVCDAEFIKYFKETFKDSINRVKENNHDKEKVQC